jgi:glycosyltransferase involved in cell wall biosynthesis
MRILIVSLSNKGGGASRAALNLFNELKTKNIDVSMINIEGDNYPDVKILNSSRVTKYIFRIKNLIVKLILIFFKNYSKDYRSLNIFPSKLLNLINNSNADIVHLHWIGAEMISIKQISKIKKIIVWTMHDAWPLNGCNHIDPQDYNIQETKRKDIIEKITLNKKIKYLADKNIHFTSPSKWLFNKYQKSFYNKTKTKCTIIPNIFDIDKWEKIDNDNAKSYFSLPINKIIIIFGANNAVTSYNKGFTFFKFLVETLDKDKYHFLVFGNNTDKFLSNKTNITKVGIVKDDKIMKKIYSAGNITLLPSRIENLPYTALESIACNTPVLAFDTGGLSDIVIHKKNGYLVEKYNKEQLIEGVFWLSKNKLENINSTLNWIKKETVINEYIKIYQEILK